MEDSTLHKGVQLKQSKIKIFCRNIKHFCQSNFSTSSNTVKSNFSTIN